MLASKSHQYIFLLGYIYNTSDNDIFDNAMFNFTFKHACFSLWELFNHYGFEDCNEHMSNEPVCTVSSLHAVKCT